MRMSHLLCAVLACAPLIFEARSTASSADGSSSAAAANVGEAAGGAAPSRNAGSKRGRTGNRGPNPVGVAQTARSNADRLHSLLNAQARGRLARQPGRGGSTRAVTHGPDDVRGLHGASLAGQSKMAVSNGAAPPAAETAGQSKLAASKSTAAMPRNSALGGSHVQELGRVGGPAISRATHSATVDGTQLHRKF
jgi:hypothetical protein